MGLAQNLRKTLSNSASRILAELFSVFIRRRAKLTLKKPDNSSTTTSSPKSLTSESLPTTIATSSADTTEKIIMDELTTEQIVEGIRTWAMDRFDIENMSIGDCRALYEEYAEWIEPQGEELEIVSMEKITPEEFERYRERT